MSHETRAAARQPGAEMNEMYGMSTSAGISQDSDNSVLNYYPDLSRLSLVIQVRLSYPNLSLDMQVQKSYPDNRFVKVIRPDNPVYRVILTVLLFQMFCALCVD